MPVDFAAWPLNVAVDGNGHLEDDLLHSIRVPRSFGGEGFDHQRLQDLLIHIGELFDVKAALAGGLLAEPAEQRLRVAGPRHPAENRCSLTWRKTGHGLVACA